MAGSSAPDPAGLDGQRNRARGALWGLAVGDALGAPYEGMTAQQVQALGPVGGLPTPALVTDDTDQALILGRLLVAGRGFVGPRLLGAELLNWRRDLARAGRDHVVGPSTRRALDLLADGVPPTETGRGGDTNGAAMRIAPVGVAVPVEPVERLQAVVLAVDRVTHHTPVAHAGSAAVAAAVSAGVDGADVAEALPLALDAAARFSAELAERIQRAVTLAADGRLTELLTGVAAVESVPTALAVATRHPADPWAACRAAVGLGGDTDTIAAMAGAMVGAGTGVGALPVDVVERVRRDNRLDLDRLADQLLDVRAE